MPILEKRLWPAETTGFAILTIWLFSGFSLRSVNSRRCCRALATWEDRENENGRSALSTKPTCLPVISASGIAGLTETLANSPFNGSAELLSLAMSLRLNAAELFGVAVVARMLGFAGIREAGFRARARILKPIGVSR